MAIDTADVVIVGAGAGGATLGGELAEAGAKVVFLEAGDDLDITFGSPDHFADSQQFLPTINLFWHEEFAGRRWRTDMGECAGGGTTTYGGVLEESTPRDYSQWPFSHHEFLPYIDLVKERFHVYRWPVDEMSHYAKLFNEVSGGELVPIQSAFNREPWFEYGVYHDRCRRCRCCILGCRYNAKANALTITLPKAKWFGAEVRDNCWVTRLNTNAAGTKIESITYLKRTGGNAMGMGEHVEEHTIYAERFVLASGSMITPMLLHWSGKNGEALANSSGQVGRNLRGHFFRATYGVLQREDVRTYQGQVVELNDNYKNYDNGFLMEYNMASPPTYMGGMVEVMETADLIDLLGLKFKRLMRYFPRIACSAPLCRSYDNGFTENFVLPHPSKTNRYGDPLPVVQFEPNAQERQWVETSCEHSRSFLRKAGVIDEYTFAGGIDVVHKVGTCRMGTDPTQAVTDLDGKVHDMDNLWIADGSLFPAPLLANCAFIIYALAYKVADGMLGRPSRMNPPEKKQ
ncbi:MAG: GMC oxidoreductase [Candidatus Alcyoniella australis]|nr:GMC oxidoreductase [Candidatus Alcyoniella australis]